MHCKGLIGQTPSSSRGNRFKSTLQQKLSSEKRRGRPPGSTSRTKSLKPKHKKKKRRYNPSDSEADSDDGDSDPDWGWFLAISLASAKLNSFLPHVYNSRFMIFICGLFLREVYSNIDFYRKTTGGGWTGTFSNVYLVIFTVDISVHRLLHRFSVPVCWIWNHR